MRVYANQLKSQLRAQKAQSQKAQEEEEEEPTSPPLPQLTQGAEEHVELANKFNIGDAITLLHDGTSMEGFVVHVGSGSGPEGDGGAALKSESDGTPLYSIKLADGTIIPGTAESSLTLRTQLFSNGAIAEVRISSCDDSMSALRLP